MSNSATGHPQATPAEVAQIRYIVTKEEWEVITTTYLEMWRVACCSRDPPNEAQKAEIARTEDEFTEYIKNDTQSSAEFVRLRSLHWAEWHRLRSPAKVEFTVFFVQLNRVYKLPLDQILKEVYNFNAPPLFRRIWREYHTPPASPHLVPVLGVEQPTEISIPTDRLPEPGQFSGYGATPYIVKVSDRATAMLISGPEIRSIDTVMYHDHEGEYQQILEVDVAMLLASLGIE